MKKLIASCQTTFAPFGVLFFGILIINLFTPVTLSLHQTIYGIVLMVGLLLFNYLRDDNKRA